MTRSLIGKQAGLAVGVALAAMTLGCSPQLPAISADITGKVHTVTPDSVKATAGIATGEVTEMEVTERIEEGSGRSASPAKRTGKPVPKNIPADQRLSSPGNPNQGVVSINAARANSIEKGLSENTLAGLGFGGPSPVRTR